METCSREAQHRLQIVASLDCFCKQNPFVYSNQMASSHLRVQETGRRGIPSNLVHNVQIPAQESGMQDYRGMLIYDSDSKSSTHIPRRLMDTTAG